MSSAPPYPPAILFLPVQVLHNLPSSFQSLDVEILIAFQALIAIPPCASINGPVYTLPLALFGLSLLAQRSSMQTSYLSHFLFLWIASFVVDLWWLLYRSGTTGFFVGACVGAGVPLKLVSAGLVGQLVSGAGLGGDYSAGFGVSSGGAAGWMGRAASSVGAGPNAPGGFWSTGGGHRADDVEEQLPGGYSSIYDEDEENAAKAARNAQRSSTSRAGAYGSYADEEPQHASSADAQHINVNVTGPPPPPTSRPQTTKGGYTALE